MIKNTILVEVSGGLVANVKFSDDIKKDMNVIIKDYDNSDEVDKNGNRCTIWEISPNEYNIIEEDDV